MPIYSKLQRQLLLYEILYTSHEAMMDDLMRRLNISKKTIQRDIEDFTDATDYPFGEEYNCKERYFELFPDVSERTRMRDYEILNGIGYTIRWDEYEKRHIVKGYLCQIREEF